MDVETGRVISCSGLRQVNRLSRPFYKEYQSKIFVLVPILQS